MQTYFLLIIYTFIKSMFSQRLHPAGSIRQSGRLNPHFKSILVSSTMRLRLICEVSVRATARSDNKTSLHCSNDNEIKL